ncbi:ATP-binding protein [Streptomyces sp. NPDC056470]|uniref:ATP-binding protein n=1 Tax=Streptomyces sp. NPDC056470 TaxID=3345831 RepID=UPI0036C34DB4
MYVTGYDTLLTGQAGGEGVQVSAPRPLVEDGNDVVEVLEHRQQAVVTACHTAKAVLEEWRMDGDAVLLIVSELVTNAVEQADPSFALHLHRERAGSRVWVGVTDGGPAQTEGAWTASCVDDEHGCGLGIVDTLADAHGTHSHSGGITHWARIAV